VVNVLFCNFQPVFEYGNLRSCAAESYYPNSQVEMKYITGVTEQNYTMRRQYSAKDNNIT
jgi:hypothetical protein